MSLDFFLNELSYRNPVQDAQSARACMSRFVRTLSALKRATSRLPIAPQLRTHEDFGTCLLAPDYSVSKWRNDESVAREERLLFRTYAAQAPFLNNLPRQATDEFPEVFLYQFAGAECQGLGYAHLLKGVAVSLLTQECWNASTLVLFAQYLSEEVEQSFELRVPHSSEPTHVNEIQSFLSLRLAEEDPEPSNLEELWTRRERMFPHLDFCAEVEKQMKRLEGVQHLNGVLTCLVGFNNYAHKWSESGGEFDPHAMANVTPESAGRIQKYGDQLTFHWCGIPRLFSFHGRFTPGHGRIHIWPDEANRRIVIGYIGLKIGIG